MFFHFHSWLRGMAARLAGNRPGASATVGRRMKKRRRCGPRPYLEQLETRLTPSFSLGGAANYGVLTNPSIHSFQSTSDSFYTGNIGIANTGGANQASPPVQWAGVLTGNIDFAGLKNISNTNGISGTVNQNVAAVNTAFNTMSTLSATLGAEAGTPLTLTGSAQTINASAGTLDASGNRVFTARNGFVLGGALTINGSASDYVVINIPAGQTAKFSKAITLTGGITDDHVLYNVLGTGNEIGGAANGATVHGVILGINRKFNMDAVTVDGRVIGGDASDLELVSNFRLVAPPAADLSITKTDSATSAVPGSSTTYTIVVSNAGPSAVTGASVSDALPAGVTAATWTATGSSGGGVVTGPTSGSGALATTVNLPVNATVTVTFTVQVNPSATGSLTNTATVSPPAGVTDPNPDNNTASDTDTLTPQADLSITKTDGVTSVAPGTSTTYTIVVTNHGPSTAVAQAVTDTFPASITSVTWTAVASAGSSVAATSGSGNIATTVTLLPGGTVTFTAVATISSTATGTLTNTATVAVPLGDTTPADNTASDTDTLTPQADLAITKTDGVTTVAPGTPNTYTIVVSNLGPSAVTGASVADALPTGVTSATWTASGSSGGGAVTGPSSGSGALATTVDLPVNATVTFTFTVQVSPSATGSLINTATVTPAAGVTDPTPANNTASDTDTLTPQSDLSITKTDGVTSVVPGGSTTYTIVVTNHGPSTAVDQAVTDLFPAEITAVSWTAVASAGSSVAQTSGTGNILTTVTLLPGGTVTFTAVAQISPLAQREVASLVNTATVAVPPGDNTPADNTATDVDSLTPVTGLAITKDDNQTTAVPGTSTTYTITVSNAGPSAATGAALSDPLPAGVTSASWMFVSETGGGSVTGPLTGTGALATTVNLPVNATVTFSFTATIDPAATGALTNIASITPPGGTPTGGTDTDTLTPQADLAVAKTVDNPTPNVGDTVTFTVTLLNKGPSVATNVSVQEEIPAGLAFISATPSQGSFDQTTAVWTVGTVGLSSTPTLNVTARVLNSIPETNTVVISHSDQFDPNLANNTSSATVRAAETDLQVTKTVDNPTPNVGDTVTFTITVSNVAGPAVKDVQVTDQLPAGLQYVSSSTADGTYNPTTGIWALAGNLPPGQSSTLTIRATMISTTAQTNTATVTESSKPDPNPGNDSGSVTVTPPAPADLQVSKTDGVLSAVPGTPNTYIIVVSNNGPSAVTGASVADALPVGVTSATWEATDSSGGGSVTGPSSGSGALATTVDLPVNATVTFTFTVQVSPSATGSLTNTATVSPPAGVTDSNPADNTATDTDNLTPQADLSITKTDGVLAAVPGTSTTYTIVVSNAGPSTAVDQAVTDLFPAEITAVSWTAVASAGSSVARTSGTGNILTTVTLLPGGTVTFTAVATISPLALREVASLVNTATVAVPPGDNTPDDNTATDTDSLTPVTGLSITKTDGVTSVVPGTPTTYTIVVSNHGPSTANGAGLSDPLPAGVTGASWIFVSATGGGSVTGPSSGSGALATTVNLPPGATLTFGFTVDIDPSATDTLVNTATVTPSGGTPTGGTDTDSLTPHADLAVTKDDGKTSVVPGTPDTYTITVSNAGPSTVSSVNLTDTVPAELLNPVFGTPSAGSYDSATGVWSGLSLATGQSVTITLTGTIDPAATGDLTNTAHVAPPNGVIDTNPANNGDSDTDTLTPQADLAVTKDDGKTSAVPGTANTYTITVTNAGPSTVSSVNLTDTVPAALLNPVFGTPSDGSYDSATGVWSGLSLATGQSATITLSGTIDPSATGTLTNTATVTPPSGVIDTNPANNSDSDTDTLTPQADLAVTKTDGVTSVAPGTSTTYTVVVSNNGPSDVTGASVADALPAGVTSASWEATDSSGGGAVTGPSSGSGALATTVDLPVNATVTFTFTVQVSPSATGTLTNTATVSPPAGVTDPNPGNNTATDSDNLTAQADLSITKDDGILAAVPGFSTTYNIVVSNAGPSTAVDQQVTDLFPAAITSVSWTAVASAGSSVAQASGTGNINTTVTLLPGGTVTFTAVAQISPSATDALTNTATVAVPPGDNTPADNTDTDTDSLTPLTGLVITKDDGQTTAVPGTSTTYTITVGNAGPSDAIGATLSDPLPAGVTAATWAFVSSTGGGSVTGPSSGSGALATTIDVPVGATLTFSFTAAIDPSATGALDNIASVTPPGGTPISGTDIDSLTPQADLAVTKDDGQTSAVPGTANTYTITVTNAGPSTVSSVILTDTVPAALLNPVFGTPSDGSYNPATGVWSGLSLATGQSVTITLTGTIDPAATGTLTNTAHVAPPTGVIDTNPANNNDTDTDALTPQADLAVTKDDGKTSAVPGTANTYTITVTNAGPSTVSSVNLTDTVPPALLNPVFGTPSDGGYDPDTGVWSGLSLATGQSVTIELTGTIDPAATGTLTNTATVSPPQGVTDTNPDNNSATDTDTLTPQSDLSITKTDGVTSVVPGGSTTYTIVVSNHGPSDVTGASVADLLPAGVISATWEATDSSGGGAVTGPSSGSGPLATTVDLPVNASVTFTFTVQVSPSATGTLTNTATVSPPAGVTDTNPADNTDTDTDNLTPQADLSITKTDGITSVVPGTNTTYTIVVTNHGPSTAVNQAVTDTFPASITSVTWTALASAGSSVAAASGTGKIATTVTLLPGGTVTFTVVAHVSPSATGSLTNTATVAVPPGDNTPADNTASDVDSLTPMPGLAISKDDGSTTAVPGALNTYTIIVSNHGPSATGATLSDPLPQGVIAAIWGYVSATGGGSVTGPLTGTGALATTVNLPVNATITFRFVAAIDPTATGALTNIASVTPPGGTPISGTDIDTLTPQADLAVTKDDGKTSVVPGTANTYTITVSNNGPSTVSSVNLTDTVPPALLNPVFGTPSDGSYNPDTRVWSGLSLAMGQSVTITLSGTIDPTATGTLTNTVHVAPPTGVTDTNSDNNDSDTDTLTPQADLAVTKTDGKTSAVPGTANTYTITVTNNGPSTVTSVNLTDTVPAALLNPVFGAPSDGGYDPDTGLWSGLSLATGQSVTIELTGTIDPAATGTLTNTATVTPPSGVTDTNPTDNTASDTDTLTPQSDLSITKTDGVTTVAPGTPNTYTIIVSNHGPSAVTGASVANALPIGVTAATWEATDSSGGGVVTGPSSGSGPLATTVDLPVNASVTFTFTVQVSPSATGTLTNTATVSPPAGVTDTNPADNTATDTDNLTPQADLSITKTDGITSVVPGTNTTYTIVVTNHGPSTAVNQAVTDNFPAAITSVSWTAVASPGSSVAVASGTGDIATTVTLLPGGTVTFTVVAHVSPSATGSLTNTATVAVPPGDNTPADNTASDVDSLTPMPGLAISKDDGSTTAVPGALNTYTIIVSNHGPSAATGATLSDPLPQGVIAAIWGFVSATGGGSVTGPLTGTGALATTVNLPVNATITFRFVAAIDPTATGALTNIASVTPPGGTPISGTDIDTLTPQADLAVTKDDGKTSVVPGTANTYTITVTNNGPSTLSSVNLTDTVPAALLNPVFGTPSAGSYNPATGVWSGLSLAMGQSVTITLTGTIDPAATGDLTNTAHVAPPNGVIDTNPANNNDSDTDTLTPQADLAVTKDDGKTSVVPGTANTYTITVTNNGPSTLSSVNLTDTVPAALLNPVFGTPSAGSYNPATGVWSGLSLAMGQSVTITLTGTIDPAATGTLTNTATVTPPAGVTDTNPANNTASDTDTLTPQADLAITKTDGVTTVAPGTPNTYTIIVSNHGPSAVTGASVADALPIGVTAATWEATDSSGGGVVTGPTSGTGPLATTVNLPVNATVTFTFTVQVSPSATGTLTNTATVSPPAGVTDPTPGNDTATDTDTLTPQSDLSITKTDGVTSVVPGTNTTYTIVVTNHGPSTAVNQAVTDNFPASITSVTWTALASAGSSVAAASGTGKIATTVTLLPGGTVTFTVVAHVSPSATGSLTNTATVAVPPGDNTPADNTASDVDSLTPMPGLAISKDDGSTTAVPGALNTYTIIVSNHGPSAATGATLSDPLPQGVIAAIWGYVSATGGGSVTGPLTGTGALATTVNLPVNATITFRFVAAIDPTATGALTNIASVTPPGGTPISGTDIDTLTPQADLAVTKDDGKTSVVPGTANTYTITVTNNGPSTVSSVNLTDTVPAALLNPVFGTPSAGSYNPATGVWSGLSLAMGQSVTITLTGTIDPTATGTLTNTVHVAPPTGVIDTNPGNNSDSDTDTLTPQADLAVTKDDGKTSVVPGTPTTYTITVTNNGPSTVTSVILTDTVPTALLNPVFGAPSAGSYDPATDVWSGLSLATGQSVTIELTGTIDPAATGTLTNTATVTPPAGVTDTNPANDTASDTDTLTPQADLAITKTDSVTSVAPGTPDTYIIVVSNNGPSAVTGASVADALPIGVTAATWEATDSSGGGAVTGPTSGTGPLATTVNLPVNATVTFTFTVQVDPSATGTLVNTATVSPPDGVTDTNPGNNTATDTDTLTPQADLSITKTDGVTSVVPGTSTTYTIVVSNAGPSTAVDQQVTDTFPAAITSVSWTAVASPGSSVAVASGTGDIVTTVTLLPGGTVTFTAVAQISPSATDALTNTATVAMPPGDNTPADNTATDTDSLTPLTGLVITKDDNQTTAVPGTSTTYTITVSNDGPSDATGAALSDPLPTGVTEASWTFVGETGGGSVTGPLTGTGDLATTVDLPVNATVTFSFTVTIDPAATGSLVNTATVTPPGGTPTGDTDTDTLTPEADLAITKDDGKTSVVPGTANTYTITVSNAGPSTVSSVNLTDTVPAALLNPVFGTPSDGSYDSATGVWSGLSLAMGQSVTITLTGTIDPAATGDLTNTAHVAPPNGVIDTNPANNNDSDTDTLTPQADLAVTKDDGVTSAVPGTANTYTITVTNNGPSTLSSVNLTDTVPAALLNPVFGTPSAGSYDPGTGVWSGLSLAMGQSVTITLTGTIDPAATGDLTNTAHVAPPNGVIDTNPANNNDSDTDTLTPQADLAVTKDDGKTSVVPGTANTYTITVTNNGPSTLSSVNLTDTVPAALLNPVFGTPNDGSYDPATGVWSGLSLATGQSVTITLSGTIDPAATGTLTNTATVSPPQGVTDTNPDNNSATDTDTLTPQADLSITKTDGVTSVVPGGSTTYTIVVTNHGPSTAVNQAVTDTFPASITSVRWTAVASAGSSVARTSGTGNILTTVTLLSDGTVTFTAVATISPSATGTLSNTATVAIPPGDNTPADNTDTDTDSLTPQADVTLTKVAHQSQVMFGQNVTFTLTVHNNGPSAATDVFVDDPLPPGLVFVSAAPSQGTFVPASGIWVVGTLAIGASATLQLTTRVAALGPIVNIAEAGADQFDANLSNNVATGTVTGANPAPIISKRSFLASSVPNPAPAASPARPLPSLATLRADVAFINDLYEGLLGRNAKAAELAYWMNLLLLGVSRSEVARRL